MKVVLAGGTGFVGGSLLSALIAEHHQVVLLTRNLEKAKHLSGNAVSVVEWDAKNGGDWEKSIDSSDVVINLSGESVANKRWTDSVKQKILDSRVNSTRAIVHAISRAEKRPSLLVNASAIGIYGSDPEKKLLETTPKGEGFLADVCDSWEKEASKAENLSIRVVKLRIGIVLGKEGGALKRMLPPFQFFLGGPLGNGLQWFPWVHRDDVVRSILYVMENNEIQGPINMAAPEPVRLKDFCKVLGKVLHRPSLFPVPIFVLRLMVGDMADMLIASQKMIPQKLKSSGFQFRYSHLEDALQAILKY